MFPSLNNKSNTFWNPNNFTYIDCYASGSQSIPNGGSGANVSFDTVRSSNNWGTRTSNSTFTPPVAGYYYVSYFLDWASSSSGTRYCSMIKNGTTAFAASESQGSAAGTLQQNGSYCIYFNGTTDSLVVSCFQASGGALNIGAGASITFQWLHP